MVRFLRLQFVTFKAEESVHCQQLSAESVEPAGFVFFVFEEVGVTVAYAVLIIEAVNIFHDSGSGITAELFPKVGTCLSKGH